MMCSKSSAVFIRTAGLTPEPPPDLRRSSYCCARERPTRDPVSARPRAACANAKSFIFPLFWNMGRLHCSMIALSNFFISGVSFLCIYSVMTTLPNPDFLRSCADTPFSPDICEIASMILRRNVTLPREPFGNGCTHRLHTVNKSKSKSTLVISFLASISITFGSMANRFIAGRLFAMLVSSASAASSIVFKKAIASSSNSGSFFVSFFFRCIRRTAALRALEALAASPPSSSLRLILSSPPPALFLGPDDAAFFFIFASSSVSYPSGRSSSKCCSA
mmetsp:Transcript_43248/g.73760  ORF Transcript_43248/g.73760 Transcript_43248/m.73760 type:complete len:277 (-) Transcript_43248:355-1185(-)